MMYSLLSLATMLSVASSLKMCTYNYMGTAPADACTATGTDEDENCSGDFDGKFGEPREPRHTIVPNPVPHDSSQGLLWHRRLLERPEV